MSQRAAWITYPREGQTIRVDLDKPKVVFGRASNCDVALTIKGVSRAHFTVVRESVGWTINDLSSTNGTYVNAQLVSRKRLDDGDEINLGPPGLVPVTLTFHQAAVAAAGEESRDSAVLEDDEDSSRNIHASISVEDYTLSPGELRRPVALGAEGSSILRGLAREPREGSSSEMKRRGVRDGAWLIRLFNEMGNALLRSESLDEMLNQVLDLAFRDLPAERGSIWLTNETGGNVTARATRNRSRTATEPISISRSIVNEAIRSRTALLVSDAVADDRFAAAVSVDQMNIRSAMCAPLYHEGRVLGFVYVDSHGSDEWLAFSEQHLEILTALAVFAAVGVEKWRMHEAAEQARQIRTRARMRLQVLLDVAKSLTSELDTTSLMQTIMIRARELCDAERCSLFLLDRERGELRSKVVEGADEIRLEMTRGIAGHVAATGEVLNIPDAYQDPRFNPEIDRQTGYRTRNILCTPLRNTEGRIIGVTELMNKAGDGPFTEEDEEIMGAFSAQAAVALENALLFQQSLETRNYLESILASIDHLVLTLDEHGRLVTVNGAVGPIFGIDEETMRARPLPEWYGGENAEFVRSVERVYRDPVPVYIADLSLKAGERSISVSYHVVPLLDFERQQKGVVIVLEDITREKRILSTLSQHIGSELAEKALEEEARLGGVRQDVAILFGDIRGYTAMTESMDAAEVVELLNEYYSLMYEVVSAEQGWLDKFIGDAVMAVFGAPLPCADYSARACRTALRMRESLARFNERRAARGLEPMGVGIGISSGTVISGYIGSEKRLEYTCIGDGVNVASRLEGLSKLYGVTALISESTASQIGDEFVTRELDLVRMVGKQQPIRVYELLGAGGDDLPPERLQALLQFRNGLRAYRDRDWERALEHFRAAESLTGDPPSKLFIRRCEYLRDHPPRESWDGVWAMTHK